MSKIVDFVSGHNEADVKHAFDKLSEYLCVKKSLTLYTLIDSVIRPEAQWTGTIEELAEVAGNYPVQQNTDGSIDWLSIITSISASVMLNFDKTVDKYSLLVIIKAFYFVNVV